MRVEDLVPGFVAKRIPERPEWVASSPRDPRTAAEVYGKFALAFSTLFFLVLTFGNPLALLYVPLVVANAAGWTWLLWRVRIPLDGTVSRRRALTTGLGIGTLSWFTVGPLMTSGVAAYRLLTGGSVGTATMDTLGATVGLGLFFSLWGFIFTLGVPTVASVGMALWLLDYEEPSGREKRESSYQFG